MLLQDNVIIRAFSASASSATTQDVDVGDAADVSDIRLRAQLIVSASDAAAVLSVSVDYDV